MIYYPIKTKNVVDLMDYYWKYKAKEVAGELLKGLK